MFEHIQRKDNGDFPYQFAKKATTCPQCGKKRFKGYINAKTGQPLPSKYGRCNRQDHCGYWLDPYKDGYGRLSPDEWKAKRIEETRQRNYVIPKPQPAKPVSFIDNETMRRTLSHYDNNTLINGLCRVCTPAAVMQAVERYNVGTTKDGGTIFWQLDADNNVRTGKVIQYKPDLHRNKDKPPSWAHTALKLPDFHLQQCLFGEHLLRGNNKPVAIAEAEKTSLVASMYMPDYVWMATGGKQNFRLIEEAAAAGKFAGRKVILYPDLGATAEWEAKAQELRRKYKVDISVSDYLESVATEQGREQGADIADILLRNAPPKAIEEPQPATPTETPAIERLQPDTIKSIAEREAPAEGKETAQNRVITPLPKTQGGWYMKTFAPVWEAEIRELEMFFESRKDNLPESVKTGHSVIVNVPLFIESHLARVKAHNGNPTFQPYLDRLTELKFLIEMSVNEDEACPF